MSRLESETQPILQPLLFGPAKPVSLSPAAQRQLAIWTYKTALVVDLMMRRQTATPIPADAYTHFYNERLPPQNDAVIWIIGYKGPYQVAATRRQLDITLPEPEPRTLKTAGYSVTFSAVRVVFQVFGRLAGKWIPRAAVTPNPRLVRIWPVNDSTVIFPVGSRGILNTEGLRQFGRRTDFF